MAWDMVQCPWSQKSLRELRMLAASILDYAIIIAVIPIVVMVIAVLVIVLRTKSRLRIESGEAEKELEAETVRLIANPTETDEIAYSIVERYRKRIWRRFSINTAFGVEAVGDTCGSLVTEIAHIYYPHSPRPELEVTVDDLLDLNQRVIARLRKLMDKFPLSRLRGTRMSQILTYHKLYAAVTANPIIRTVRKKWARRAARGAAIAARYANPKFWVMRGVTRGGREFAARYLLTALITIAGEESILLYRRGQSESEEKPPEPDPDDTKKKSRRSRRSRRQS